MYIDLLQPSTQKTNSWVPSKMFLALNKLFQFISKIRSVVNITSQHLDVLWHNVYSSWYKLN